MGLVVMGAPYMWTALVAAIDWLMEVTKIKHVGDQCGFELDQGDGNGEDLNKEAMVVVEALFKNPMINVLDQRYEKSIMRT